MGEKEWEQSGKRISRRVLASVAGNTSPFFWVVSSVSFLRFSHVIQEADRPTRHLQTRPIFFFFFSFFFSSGGGGEKVDK